MSCVDDHCHWPGVCEQDGFCWLREQWIIRTSRDLERSRGGKPLPPIEEA